MGLLPIYWVVSVGIVLWWGGLRTRQILPRSIVMATVFATWFSFETALGIPATFLRYFYNRRMLNRRILISVGSVFIYALFSGIWSVAI